MKYLKHVSLCLILFFSFSLFGETKSLSKNESNARIEEEVRSILNLPNGDLNDHDYQKVRYLNLNGLGLSDIEVLSKMTNLNTLLMSDNEIVDISPISKLPLSILAFHNNKIVDISALKSMNNLSVLYCRNNLVTDMSPLFELNIKRAVLSGNPLEKVELPKKLKGKVRYKVLSKQESVEAIEKVLREKLKKPTGVISQSDCDGLTNLALNEMGLSDITLLSKCRNLTTLNLHMNEVVDVSPLSGLTKLTHLNLGSNRIEDISPLKDLMNLKTLIIYINDIENLEVVANMKNLTFLSAYENKITEVKYVHHLKGARRIKFHDNPVPVSVQEECHKHLPNVELMFKVANVKNYYNTNRK